MAEAPTSTAPHDSHGPSGTAAKLALTLLALGVVFGDIGTSPLYAIKESLSAHHGMPRDPSTVLGVLSLFFWSLTIVIAIKYAWLVLQADNRGAITFDCGPAAHTIEIYSAAVITKEVAIDGGGRVRLFAQGSSPMFVRPRFFEVNGSGWSNTTFSTRPAAPPTSVIVTSIIYSMAYDAARSRTVLLSSANATTTWEYNGATQTWSQAFPTTQPVFNSARLAYDPVGGRVIAVNRGTSTLETWGWNGTTWTLLSSAGPVVSGFAIATDTTRQRVMLFGGGTANTFASETNDLWEWNGSSWSQRTVTGTFPPKQRTGVMAFDSSRNKLVLLGGRASGSNDGLTWEFDGTRWTFFPAPFRYGDVPGLAYDEARQAVVLFGGNQATTATSLYELKR
jgi:hypothetical protein